MLLFFAGVWAIDVCSLFATWFVNNDWQYYPNPLGAIVGYSRVSAPHIVVVWLTFLMWLWLPRNKKPSARFFLPMVYGFLAVLVLLMFSGFISLGGHWFVTPGIILFWLEASCPPLQLAGVVYTGLPMPLMYLQALCVFLLGGVFYFLLGKLFEKFVFLVEPGASNS